VSCKVNRQRSVFLFSIREIEDPLEVIVLVEL
jgi:hypothetical protein